LKDNGHLDVGGAVGAGTLTVIRDLGLREPYVGTIRMPSGEIAEDLTYYFAESEQVPSSVGLGVLVDTDLSVRQSGGFIIQVMPQADGQVINQLETVLRSMKSVTSMLSDGLTPEMILSQVLGELDVKIEEKMPVSFSCDCSKDRVRHVLSTLQMSDLESLAADNKPIDIACNFCGKSYRFDADELREIVERRRG
jgi:molecular chaperone Hsp33